MKEDDIPSYKTPLKVFDNVFLNLNNFEHIDTNTKTNRYINELFSLNRYNLL